MNARTGAVRLLKDGQRIQVPVDPDAIDAAVSNVEWAVDRIREGDFPRRPSKRKCEGCDFAKICSEKHEGFAAQMEPVELHLPDGQAGKSFLKITAFSDVDQV